MLLSRATFRSSSFIWTHKSSLIIVSREEEEKERLSLLLKIIRDLAGNSIIDKRMAAYPTSNTLSSTSSLSYHHLFSHGVASGSGTTTGLPHHPTDTSLISELPNHPALFDSNSDLSFCQATNYFDVAIPSSSSHHYHHHSHPADPLVRHFFNYRQNDPNNATGNYYSNFDYSAAVDTQSNPYVSYPPIGASGLATAQQEVPQQQQQQNIYPWMRRIHHGCGKNFLFTFEDQCFTSEMILMGH